jgi:hypothetical protein
MGAVQCTSLGRLGRWGNQLFQYAFTRKFAETTASRLELPPWVGEDVFDLRHARVSRPLPLTALDEVPWGATDVNLHGYFQFQECLDLFSQRELRRWFTPRPDLARFFTRPRRPYVACHLRRGDYVRLSTIYCVVSRASYVRHLERLGVRVADVIWVSDDEPRAHHPFLESCGLGFLDDFFTLVDADVILRANSTFSWWAAALSNAVVWSPLVNDLTAEHDVEFVAGNHPKFFDPKNSPGAQHTDLHLPD